MQPTGEGVSLEQADVTVFEKAARRVEAVVVPLTNLTKNAGAAILGILMLMTTADVVLRYFFNRPIRGAYDLTTLMLLAIVFSVIAYAQIEKRHVSINLLFNRLSEPVQAFLQSATYLLCTSGFIIVVWRGIIQAEHLREIGRGTALLNIPLYPFMWVLALGSLFLCLAFVIDILRGWDNISKHFEKTWMWVAISFIPTLIVITFPYWFAMLPLDVSSVAVGFIGIGIFLVLLFSRMLIGPALLVIGFAGYAYLTSMDSALNTMGMTPFRSISNYTLTALPLFVLMGLFAFHGDLTSDVYKALHRWIGHLRGGLAVASVGGCGFFAAVSGSSIANAVTMGTITIPEMRKYKYSDSLSCGCVAAGGTVGALIPPSVPLIVYGTLTEQSVGLLFMAGIIPGIIEVSLYVLTIVIMTRLKPEIAPPGPRATWGERLVSIKGTFGILALFALVMGGIYNGWFTPTEAAGVGAFGAFTIAFLKRKLNLQRIGAALTDTLKHASMIFLLMIAADVFSVFLTRSHIPFEMADFFTALPLSPLLIIIGITIMYIVLGCVMPIIPLILLTIPVVFPVVTALGYDPIWFAILMVFAGEMGQITPPIGMNVLMISGVAKDVPVAEIFKGVFPFFVADLVRVALLIAFPAIALYIPRVLMGG